ncbi:hypothetical protein N825_00895 [Skermanella stibiiresistens SB22]|uniref:Uncharacterized protein n=1 Tax=Skermanella stibiiresistens SB22 TaxID=1385369 RepID=W9HDL2_9PROT|nr:hypothetical protein [Skermanella stibiiresistens]EWY42811.1 hypothetical protein N825_00895 [Skermanella stibiiresistens SB22]
MTEEICRRILLDPSLIDVARGHLERFMDPDPHQAPYYAMWRDLLDLPPAELVEHLLEDSPRGDLVRETMPSFGGIQAGEAMEIIRKIL